MNQHFFPTTLAVALEIIANLKAVREYAQEPTCGLNAGSAKEHPKRLGGKLKSAEWPN